MQTRKYRNKEQIKNAIADLFLRRETGESTNYHLLFSETEMRLFFQSTSLTAPDDCRNCFTVYKTTEKGFTTREWSRLAEIVWNLYEEFGDNLFEGKDLDNGNV